MRVSSKPFLVTVICFGTRFLGGKVHATGCATHDLVGRDVVGGAGAKGHLAVRADAGPGPKDPTAAWCDATRDSSGLRPSGPRGTSTCCRCRRSPSEARSSDCGEGSTSSVCAVAADKPRACRAAEEPPRDAAASGGGPCAELRSQGAAATLEHCCSNEGCP